MGQFCQHTNPQKKRAFRFSLLVLCQFCSGSGGFSKSPPRSRKIRQSPSQGCHFNRSARNANGLLATTETTTLFIFDKRNSASHTLSAIAPNLPFSVQTNPLGHRHSQIAPHNETPILKVHV